MQSGKKVKQRLDALPVAQFMLMEKQLRLLAASSLCCSALHVLLISGVIIISCSYKVAFC